MSTIDYERLHRKQRLTGALRILGRLGFGEGTTGHFTVRDPELTDHFWMNPFGRSFRYLRVQDLILLDQDGNLVQGSPPLNRAGVVLHSAIHRARPDVIAVAHAHSVHGKAFSALAMPLDPITQDACVFYGDHAVIADAGGTVVLEAEAGRQVAEGLGANKAGIHQSHGLFTVGQSVDEAAFWLITLERSCQVQLLAMAAGRPTVIAHERALATAAEIGSPEAGRFSFQPLWEEICRTDADLFD